MRPALLLLGSAIVACSSVPASDSTSDPFTTPSGSAAPSASPTSSSTSATPPGPVGAFPSGFQYGTAIAGFQVDMGCPTVAASVCEDRASDWYQWITTDRIENNPLLFMSKQPPSQGPGFYETYPQDIASAPGNALRLSIEWSRIFPNPTFGIDGHAALAAIASPDGVAFYHRLFAAMKAKGLRPFVTVNHYTLPLWIHDGNACNQSLDDCIAAHKAGWADPDRSRITDEIAKYARFLGEEYGGEVDTWATLNEPFSAVVVAGYLVSTSMRSNPPGLSGPWMSVSGAKTAAAAMIEANAKMYDALKSADTRDADGDGHAADVGIVYSYSDIRANSTSADDQQAAADAEYFFHDMFMDGVVNGRLDENWDQGPGVAPVRADLAGRADFVGVNYYFGFSAKKFITPLSFVSKFVSFDMTQPFDENHPQGLHDVLMRVAQRYKRPVYVSETGTKQDDPERGAAWLVRTMSETKSAIHDGADVRGFYAWSLMDNYEWNSGMSWRFGLYAVDPTTKARTERSAGAAFTTMSNARDVPADLSAKYASFFP